VVVSKLQNLIGSINIRGISVCKQNVFEESEKLSQKRMGLKAANGNFYKYWCLTLIVNIYELNLNIYCTYYLSIT